MIDRLIEEINKKYNLQITYKMKIPEVYFIYFNLEGKQVNFNFMFDRFGNYETNFKEFEKKVNSEIINFYLRKDK